MFIDGVAQCQVIDKSGEVVDLKGHDITSLAKTGTFTWEHQAGTPATLVGKILKAKKIFSKDDCESDRELYFWNKVKCPYLYVMGELLDDYTASARECAGQMRYSKDNPDKQPLLGFSIEGSEIPNTRKGMVITRSIARKVTLTQAPCNSACVAEIYNAPEQKSQVKDDFDEIFKSQEEAITLFKSGEGEKMYESFLAKKEADAPHVMPVSSKAPKTFGQRSSNVGTKIGTTSSGKDVHSHGKVGEYGFNSGEHKEASEMHRKAAISAPTAKLADNHLERMRLHNQAALTAGHREGRFAAGLAGKKKAAMAAAKPPMAKGEPCEKHKKLHKDQFGYPGTASGAMAAPPPEPPKAAAQAVSAGVNAGDVSVGQAWSNIKSGLGFGKSDKKVCEKHKKPLKKAIEAGSYNAAPSTLVNGAAYQTESMSKQSADMGEGHNFQATKKKDWNKQAKDDYDRWPHREKFEKFMKARMPHLADGEIRAIGKIIALKKSMDFEKSLEGLVFLEKAEDPSKKKTFNPKIRQVAEQHMAQKGLKLEHPESQVKVNPDFASKVAQAYHEMKHDPNHPDVKRSYDALKQETMDQFKTLKNTGLKVSSIKQGQQNPYKTSQDLLNDIHQNNHLWFFPTEQGFGSGNKKTSDHPMLQPTEEMHEGKPLLANDVFRIVHDYFGHAKEGNGFGPNGEENAWQNHARMYSPEAKKALTTETRGQNSWVNFGPHGAHNRANPAQTVYADQKAGILPDWAHKEKP